MLAEYDVPIFLDQAYLSSNKIHQQWFKLIGLGGNLRTAQDLPITLTKKMAHYVLQAPSHYTIHGALRYGQILALDGDQKNCRCDFRDEVG